MPNKTINTKPKLERHYTCTVCSTSYIAKRHTLTPICSQVCKDVIRSVKAASRVSKRVSARLEKLPYSDSWLWIAREARRAGTVEILQGVDLVKLFEVYNYKFKTYGYDSESRKSKFHICHISPVAGDNTVGLLHHTNLFIGGSLPNQVQGKKAYSDAGLSIRKASLLPKWSVLKDDTDKQTLAKIQKYLGSKLTDYAKSNKIVKANRFVIAERISKHPDNTTALSDLRKMGTQALLKLEASLTDKEAYAMRLTAKRSLVVYHTELERFASYDTEKKDDYLFVAAAVRVVAQYLAQQPNEHFLSDITATGYRWYYEFRPLSLKLNKDLNKLRDFVGFTAFDTLQGAGVDRALITNTLCSYLQVDTLTVVENGTPCYDDSYTDFCYLQEELDEFLSNVPKVKSALTLTGLVDSTTHQRLHQTTQSIIIANSFKSDMQCSDYYQYDFSEYNIQVEDEFNLPVLLSSLPDIPLPF